MQTIDCAVIGAGVVGLAIARATAMAGLETLVLEGERQFGTATSARSSEVIHAGLYYRPGSLKARLCVDGLRMLYAYCAARGVPHAKTGKLIVATSAAQLPKLDDIVATAAANGVVDLEQIDKQAVRRIEPELNAVAALLSPLTGIVDSHGYMLALLGDAEAHGATVSYRTIVTGLRPGKDGIAITVAAQTEPILHARVVINAAGLGATALAAATEGFPAERVPAMRLAKGSYFTLAGKAPFSRLIYPVPAQGGLGIHMTLDLGGQARFGPDVEWVDRLDYAVDPHRAEAFETAIRAYWPGLQPDRLSPGYAGIRPKLVGPGEPDADFVILGPADHGVPGMVHLFGLELPGLTASLATAEHVANLLR